MRLGGVLALLSIVALGCGAFSGDPPAKTSDDAGTSSDAGSDPSPSPSLDASVPDAPGVETCSVKACGAGTTCCQPSAKDALPACSGSCEGGLSFACTKSSDCSPAQFCCLQGNAATCESSCPSSGAQVCGANTDCPGGECRSGSCTNASTKASFSIRTCTSGSRFFDISGPWSCQL